MRPEPIRQLPDALINQIAAGEVVERPVSIVKELVENSLDAGASEIRIELEEGGVRRLLVRDNGHGIPRSELRMALRRHCTSKLRREEELALIGTLGFRGEALAAIAAVSELSLTSRTAEEATGWRVVADRPESDEPVAHPVGTSVEIRDLFARVPARRRFLRQTQTEWLQVLGLARRLAFSNPDVAFTLVHDGQRALAVPASAPEDAGRRLRALFGSEFAYAALPVSLVSAGIVVGGCIAAPALARSQADLQTLVVNGRVIRDRQLSHAVRLAYDTLIPPGRYPCFALEITVPRESIDVNVHPGKLEVRFSDLRTVHDAVYSAVKNGLGGIEGDRVEENGTSLVLPLTSKIENNPPPATTLRDAPAYPLQRAAARRADVAVLAILPGRYLLLSERAGLVIVDVPGVLERLLAYRFETEALTTRPLLFPVRVRNETAASSGALERWLAGLGLAVNRLDNQELALRSLPASSPDIDPERLGPALAAEEPGLTDSRAALARVLAQAARLPATLAETAGWWQRWSGIAATAGLDIGAHVRRLDERALRQWFADVQRDP